MYMKLRLLMFILCIYFASNSFVLANEPSLEIMVGEMIIVGFEGESLKPNAPILQALRENKVGGIILFDRNYTFTSTRNISSPEQVKKLIAQLKEATTRKLFIALDQEGGKVQRLSAHNGFQDWLSAKDLGKLSPTEISKYAYAMGKVMAELGFNLNFAPVVDLDYPNSPAISFYDRAFSPSPYNVYISANAFVQGMDDANIISTLKHFPGHGSASLDTHNSFIDISKTWEERELLPYKSFIQEGFKGMIMTAHISMDKFNNMPATLSPIAINGLLRQKLGFDGVVISDDLQMKALTNGYGLEETIYLTVKAGVDILLIGNNIVVDEYMAQKAYDILLGFVKDGKISKERIRESWQRIHAMKELYL